jgi:prepilin-type N-terminal cleavage/methylation domain-containing protein
MSSSNQRGFTLVEMSVVLLVIGLILGAVSIGKDVQRNAEYMKIKQKFIDQWATAYNDYYLRTGVVVGDSQTDPRFMVNGATYGTPAPGTVLTGGDMTGVAGPAELCDANLMKEMDRIGVRMPPGRAEGYEDRYVYLDSNGNPQEVQVCFRWNGPKSVGAVSAPGAGFGNNSGNVMVIKGLTPDLARTLDQEVDGKPDAQEGMFRQEVLSTANGTPGQPGVEWEGNNTNATPGGFSPAAPCNTGTATGTSPNLDEDQVCVYTADYKMNQ